MKGIRETLGDISPEILSNSTPGSNYLLIRCPYHKHGLERTPSLSVSTTKPVFHCHSCKEAGHISRLLKDLSGLNSNAIQIMLDGLDVVQAPYDRAAETINKIKRGNPLRGNYHLDESVMDGMRLAPIDLLDKGFKESTLRHFEIGFDLSRYRTIYPLRNVYGELLGLSGRTVLDEEPRYKLYRRELIDKGFNIPADYSLESVKSGLLWHAHIVHPFLLKERDELIVVEGFKACMWVYQAGFENVVALAGSYLSDIHAAYIASVTQRVILYLDNDYAGKKGTWAGGMRLLNKIPDLRVATYPENRNQPDDLTPDEVSTMLALAPSYYDWRKTDGRLLPEDERRLHRWALRRQAS